MMLEEILDYIHNYFEKKKNRGSFTISSNSLNVDFLQEGQYFRIVGSVFNDGVYQYPCNNLHDEKFNGEVWALAIPLEVIKIAEEAEEWTNKNMDIINSPYTSESFGGYSYSKATGTSGSSSENGNVSWKNVYGNRLNHWRKLS